MRIVVLGYLVRGPLGGMAWHHLQYVVGLADLGHDVWFLEDSDDYESCYDPRADAMTADPSFGLAFAADAFRRLELAERWAYYDAHTSRWHGPGADRAIEVCNSADVLLHLSASNRLRDWHVRVPRRVLVDTDPLFTQVRHLTRPEALAKARLHTDFFTFGENIGRSARVPGDGFAWQPTRQPIVLRAWPVTPGDLRARYTTVMQWESYSAVEHGGERYGMKAQSFGPYMTLPERSGETLEIAAGAPAQVTATLAAHGWRVADPLEVAADPWRYRDYIRASKGEFTVAKHGYVASASGWFSERSAAYLASGRPVVTQDTGFAEWLPIGEGVLAFDSPDAASAALAAVGARYAHHCRAARRIAEAHFEAGKVLGALLARIGA
jgi:hypothetical protein